MGWMIMDKLLVLQEVLEWEMVMIIFQIRAQVMIKIKEKGKRDLKTPISLKMAKIIRI